MKQLPAVLRAALAADPASDADLLGRYADRRDGEAFAALVHRHGRLVWAACRHQTRTAADAEDAFQAVFLALAKSPHAVRDPARLSAWLYAVAHRVCGKLRQANSRRVAREEAVARREAGRAVPDSAWDQALAAVHEEVARLPESLRVPFVLCCLDGLGVSEAASRLGWKLGTLSGRLTRAKDRLAARLDARGLTAGASIAVACGGAVPAAVAGRAVGLAVGGVTVPNTILTLSHGAIGMGVNRLKLLAAGLLVAGGLGAGAGGWLAAAGAQQPKPAAAKPADPAKPTNQPEGLADLDLVLVNEANSSPKWEYHYRPQLVGPKSGVKPSELQALLEQMEKDGWAFVGEVTMRVGSTLGGEPKGDAGVTLPTLVFRRPAKQTAMLKAENLSRYLLTLDDANQNTSRFVLGDLPAQVVQQADPTADRIKALEAELAALKAKQAAGKAEAVFTQSVLPLGVHELQDIMARMAKKRFGDDRLQFVVNPLAGGTLHLSGDQASVDWASGVLKGLAAAMKGNPPVSAPQPTTPRRQ
ncbi:MAG: RNA polymerase sigma factor [Gemmataceae bacterium]